MPEQSERIDFSSMSRDELTKLRADIDRAMAEAAAREHGFSLAELTAGTSNGHVARGKRGGRSAASTSSPPTPSEAKYRNPENPEQTWSGRGRRPQWVHEATANGRALADLGLESAERDCGRGPLPSASPVRSTCGGCCGRHGSGRLGSPFSSLALGGLRGVEAGRGPGP